MPREPRVGLCSLSVSYKSCMCVYMVRPRIAPVGVSVSPGSVTASFGRSGESACGVSGISARDARVCAVIGEEFNR